MPIKKWRFWDQTNDRRALDSRFYGLRATRARPGSDMVRAQIVRFDNIVGASGFTFDLLEDQEGDNNTAVLKFRRAQGCSRNLPTERRRG